MNKSDLITKYKHHLTLKNYSENTLRSYLNGLHIFLDYLRSNQIINVTGKELEQFFYQTKKELNYSYSMMMQLMRKHRIKAL